MKNSYILSPCPHTVYTGLLEKSGFCAFWPFIHTNRTFQGCWKLELLQNLSPAVLKSFRHTFLLFQPWYQWIIHVELAPLVHVRLCVVSSHFIWQFSAIAEVDQLHLNCSLDNLHTYTKWFSGYMEEQMHLSVFQKLLLHLTCTQTPPTCTHAQLRCHI